MFDFNLETDDLILEPVAKGYRTLPNGAQAAMTNFADWTSYPSTALNSTLQMRFENAALAGIHFLVNGLTLGMADLTSKGDEPEDADFGQTLALLSAPEGPYVVMPFFGPGTVRSHTGSLVDTVTDPLRFAGTPAAETIQLAAAPVGLVTFRGNNFDQINDVKYNSADPYARTRSIYYQFREGLLRDGDAGEPSTADDAFEQFLEEDGP